MHAPNSIANDHPLPEHDCLAAPGLCFCVLFDEGVHQYSSAPVNLRFASVGVRMLARVTYDIWYSTQFGTAYFCQEKAPTTASTQVGGSNGTDTNPRPTSSLLEALVLTVLIRRRCPDSPTNPTHPKDTGGHR